MVVLTISGPDTYYEYRGKQLGTQYLMCEKFAEKIGVSLRVDICRSVDEMVKKFESGDADMIVYPIPTSTKGIIPCGYSTDQGKLSWAVRDGNTELADSIKNWYKPEIAANVKREERELFSTQSIHRHVYANAEHTSRHHLQLRPPFQALRPYRKMGLATACCPMLSRIMLRS